MVPSLALPVSQTTEPASIHQKNNEKFHPLLKSYHPELTHTTFIHIPLVRTCHKVKHSCKVNWEILPSGQTPPSNNYTNNWEAEHGLSLPQGQILDTLLAFTKSVLYSPSDIRAGVVSEYLDSHLNFSQHCSSTIEAPCVPGQESLL